MKYYGVVTEIYNDGSLKTWINYEKKCDKRPDNTFVEEWDKDVYVDWFNNKDMAQRFVDSSHRL